MACTPANRKSFKVVRIKRHYVAHIVFHSRCIDCDQIKQAWECVNYVQICIYYSSVYVSLVFVDDLETENKVGRKCCFCSENFFGSIAKHSRASLQYCTKAVRLKCCVFCEPLPSLNFAFGFAQR